MYKHCDHLDVMFDTDTADRQGYKLSP